MKTIGYRYACQSASDCSNIITPISGAQGKSLLNSNVTIPVSSLCRKKSPRGKPSFAFTC